MASRIESTKHSKASSKQPLVWRLASTLIRVAASNKLANLGLAGLGNQVNVLIEEQIGAHLQPLARQVRRVTLGVLLIILSASMWFLTAVILLIAVFLELSPYGDLSLPAMQVGGISAVIGLIMLLTGIRAVKYIA